MYTEYWIYLILITSGVDQCEVLMSLLITESNAEAKNQGEI